MSTQLIFHEKKITKEADIIEIKIWRVPKTSEFPEGIKYSLIFIHGFTRVLGYDNEHGKGHHKHVYDIESKIHFKNWRDLIKRFRNEVNQLRSELYGSKS